MTCRALLLWGLFILEKKNLNKNYNSLPVTRHYNKSPNFEIKFQTLLDLLRKWMHLAKLPLFIISSKIPVRKAIDKQSFESLESLPKAFLEGGRSQNPAMNEQLVLNIVNDYLYSPDNLPISGVEEELHLILRVAVRTPNI